MNPPTQQPSKPAPKKTVKWTSRLTLIILAFFTIAGIWGYWQWKTVPKYWTQNQTYLTQTDALILDQNATALENSIPNKFSNPDNLSAQSSRKVRIPLELINAWLKVRLPLWVTDYYGYEMPENIKDIMLATEGDNLILAFQIKQDDFDQIISAIFDIQFNSDNSATLKLVGLRAGTLPLPVNASLQQFGEIENMTGETSNIQITKLGEGLTFNPSIHFGGSRDTQIIGLQTEQNSIIIHIQQVAHKQQSARNTANPLTKSTFN